MDRPKVWPEPEKDGKFHFGMSSALGATKDDLPINDSIPNGSDAMDYTTKKVYFFDGVSWN